MSPLLAAVRDPHAAAATPDRAQATADDLELAKRCVAGEERAQRAFVARYAPLVFSVCRRRGVPADAAEDLTQDALADAFRSLPGYRGEARLSSWLFTFACRRVASYYRGAERRELASSELASDAAAVEPADADWETRVADADRAARVRRAVEALGEPARTILLAYYLAELSVREIAAELDLPAGTVKSHLHRGRLAVRRRLEAR